MELELSELGSKESQGLLGCGRTIKLAAWADFWCMHVISDKILLMQLWAESQSEDKSAHFLWVATLVSPILLVAIL